MKKDKQPHQDGSGQTNKLLSIINIILLITLISSFGINQYVIAKTHEAMGIKKDLLTKIIKNTIKKTENDSNGIELSGNIMDDAIKLAIAQGVPEIYGEELVVAFEQVQQSNNIMKQFDPTYGKKKIILTGDALRRYIDVGLKIACEYCCGSKSIIRQSGEAACGCAHSQAMRGLAAYLIQNHSDKYTNDEILRELARWKAVYFPKQMIKKLASQLQGGTEFTPDTASLVLNVNLPEYEGGKGAPLPSEIKNLPGMVGGC